MSRPESAGLSGPRLQHIDGFVQQKYLDTGKLPCALTLVERNGEIAHLSALGRMDVERNRPLQEDTIFRIYSMTKPLTSLALMMLVEEGRVALDDPVHRYIPQWRELGVYEGGFIGSFRTRRTSAPMRVIDLMRHTSGLTYGFQQRTNVDAAYRKLALGELPGAVALERMVDELGKLPLEFSPGTAFNYSVSTDVVGYLVGKISGQPFEQFLRTRIIDPLGMSDTDFMVPAAKASRFAACYAATADGRMTLQDDPQTSGFLQPPGFVSGGGGLVSTAADYLRFCRMLLNGGALDGVRLVSPKTLELMSMNHLPGGKELPDLSVSLFSEATYGGVGFGLGFAVSLSPVRSLIPGSAGDISWGGLASTYFWVDPRERLIVIFMTQLTPSATYPIRRELRTLVYSAFT
jgi:CubicO group peptidase (beta-lactamase class C family)